MRKIKIDRERRRDKLGKITILVRSDLIDAIDEELETVQIQEDLMAESEGRVPIKVKPIWFGSLAHYNKELPK